MSLNYQYTHTPLAFQSHSLDGRNLVFIKCSVVAKKGDCEVVRIWFIYTSEEELGASVFFFLDSDNFEIQL